MGSPCKTLGGVRGRGGAGGRMGLGHWRLHRRAMAEAWAGDSGGYKEGNGAL
jgi:hypothetical protein